ncbi:MAG: dehalogenase [Dehalococcoidales bacterium]|nr:dehalogenase [Dehalococcoidales bacterium]
MFLAGMLAGIALLGLVIYIRYKNIDIRWYEWLLGALGIGLLLFTLQNMDAALKEHWEGTHLTFLLVFGAPALVLIALSATLPFLRSLIRKKQINNPDSTSAK